MARFGAFAERYFVEDANTALIKSRQFAERLTLLVAERAAIELPARADFSDVLRRIGAEGIVSRDVLDMLHRLRKEGNETVHGVDGERRAAFDAIRLCHRLGVWLRASITNKPGLTITFVPPEPPPDEAEAVRKQIAEYRAKLSEVESESNRLAQQAASEEAARLTAEERARLAEEERQIIEQLALETEARSSVKVDKADARAFLVAAQASGQALDIDERDTRVLVDNQLRVVDWKADSEALKWSSPGFVDIYSLHKPSPSAASLS